MHSDIIALRDIKKGVMQEQTEVKKYDDNGDEITLSTVQKKHGRKVAVALYMPEIPQNTGTIIRTCSALGLELFIVHPCGFIWDSKFLKRSAMDYMESAKIAHLHSFPELLKLNRRIILAVSQGENVQEYQDFEYESDDIILFGRESCGLPNDIEQTVQKKITIPMQAEKRSLNLAVSVAMIVSMGIYRI